VLLSVNSRATIPAIIARTSAPAMVIAVRLSMVPPASGYGTTTTRPVEPENSPRGLPKHAPRPGRVKWGHGAGEGTLTKPVFRPFFIALTVGAAVVMAACTTGGPNPPTTSTVGGPPGSAAVNAAVRDYFLNVLGPGDWARMAEESTGNLVTLAGWLQRQNIVPSESSRGKVVIQQQRVTSISGNEAKVALVASRTAEDYQVDYTGTVTLNRISNGWKVADYFMDGQSVAASVFPNVSGGATKSGVAIRPVGVQLLPGQVNVWAEITNHTLSQLSWNQPMVVIDSQGRQLGQGSLYVSSPDDNEPFIMTGNVSAFGDFAIGNATLTLSMRSFTLVTGATSQGSKWPVDLRVPVRLG